MDSAALHLAQQGKKITVIDMISQTEIASDAPFLNKLGLMWLLRQHGVEFKMEVKLEEITKGGVLLLSRDRGFLANRYILSTNYLGTGQP